MNEGRSFIFYPEWRECVNKIADPEDRYALLQMIMDYGCAGEYSKDNAIMVPIFETLIKPKIDYAQQKYQEKVENGKNYGRRKRVDDETVRELARDGKSAKEIADFFEVSTNAIYHNEGWKNRFKQNL